MKILLDPPPPAREQYYRPTRARDLRQRAERLEGWWRRLPVLTVGTALFCAPPGAVLLLWLADAFRVTVGWEALFVCLPSALWIALFLYQRERLPGTVMRLRAEAKFHEVEHLRRYEGLPAAEEA